MSQTPRSAEIRHLSIRHGPPVDSALVDVVLGALGQAHEPERVECPASSLCAVSLRVELLEKLAYFGTRDVAEYAAGRFANDYRWVPGENSVFSIRPARPSAISAMAPS